MVKKEQTFAEYLEEFAGYTGEPIEYVVIGTMGWEDDYGSDCVPNYAEIPKFSVLSWDEGRKWLNFKTEYGYGSPKQPAIYAYTKDYVIAMQQYDGATQAFMIPRNPIECKPGMPGGS